jgi:hypothetical protein
MRIRRLARNAAFITVAAMVMGGFSTGIAGAASAAPTSTMSAASAPVTPGGTAPRVPRMPENCTEFCSIGISGHTFYIIQQFGCTGNQGHSAVSGTIYRLVNNCANRVYYYYASGGNGCISGHSQQGRSPFPNIDYYFVGIYAKC